MSPDLPAVQLGNVAEWGQVLAVLGVGVIARRRDRVDDFGVKLSAEAAATLERIADRADQDETFAALLESGLEAAARAAAEQKRWMLAKVVAAAFAGDDARVNELDVLLATVAAIEPYDLRLLLHIAIPRPGEGQLVNTMIEGALRDKELESVMHDDDRHLLGPMLSKLERESLVRDAALGTYDYSRAWAVTPYGRRLLDFLPGDSHKQQLRGAHVVALYAKQPPILTVRNLGPRGATITEVEATCDHIDVLGFVELPQRLEPDGPALEIGARQIPDNACAVVRVVWLDDEGNIGTFGREFWH